MSSKRLRKYFLCWRSRKEVGVHYFVIGNMKYKKTGARQYTCSFIRKPEPVEHNGYIISWP